MANPEESSAKSSQKTKKTAAKKKKPAQSPAEKKSATATAKPSAKARADSKVKAKPNAKAGAGASAKSDVKAKPGASAKSEAKAKPGAKAKSEAKATGAAKAKLQVDAKAKTSSKPKTKPKARVKPKQKPRSVAPSRSAVAALTEPRLEGMGALVHERGVGFRVWGINADLVEVMGDFNGWAGSALELEGDGHWYGFIEGATPGQEYGYRLTTGDNVVERMDPQARQLTNSVGNSVIYDPSAFDWEGDERIEIERQKLVIYEMHLGTFAGTFEAAVEKLRYLEALGINCIELMPIAEFPGDLSWGYNPAHLFAVEASYGGPDGFKLFVREAHRRGIAVLLDVVYNHVGPSDTAIWDFDGTDPDHGGPYFFPDERSNTPWGDTRPNYGIDPVQSMIRDNARMWISEYHVDGLRCDSTIYIRRDRPESEGGSDIPEGWSLLQGINDDLDSLVPRPFTIAEDLQGNDWITKPTDEQGAGFDAQWDGRFVYEFREMLTDADDTARSPGKVAEAMARSHNGDIFQSVIYTENHDEVANGKSRVPQEIDPDDPSSFWARARSSLGAFLMLTSPGIPMIFQGQERFDDGWFQDDTPIDWSPVARDRDLLHLYRDLIVLRTRKDESAPGLDGHGLDILGVDEENGWLAYRRYYPDDDNPGSLVIVQMRANEVEVRLENVRDGNWIQRFTSGSALYREEQVDRSDAQVQDGVFVATLPGYCVAVYSME